MDDYSNGTSGYAIRISIICKAHSVGLVLSIFLQFLQLGGVGIILSTDCKVRDLPNTIYLAKWLSWESSLNYIATNSSFF